ncbi:hypothetical protein DERP_013628 [Dermatophagoides pteronyssinus]|uniref:Uncharacterized protein n=1 Tax=Dermatophagoides pteronyssinus TaxID=6956 RepID=A0ABQ8IPS3_DERPT|nr:hypothetical protein DERP_013628 [Dermatophagoides pteronyssinus]
MTLMMLIIVIKNCVTINLVELISSSIVHNNLMLFRFVSIGWSQNKLAIRERKPSLDVNDEKANCENKILNHFSSLPSFSYNK